jgi:hypothetical protein
LLKQTANNEIYSSQDIGKKVQPGFGMMAKLHAALVAAGVEPNAAREAAEEVAAHRINARSHRQNMAINQPLSDRLWHRTGLTLAGWIWAVIAVISFSVSIIFAWNSHVQHQREQQQIRDTLTEIRDGLESDRRQLK